MKNIEIKIDNRIQKALNYKPATFGYATTHKDVDHVQISSASVSLIDLIKYIINA